MTARALIIDPPGTRLTQADRTFLRESDPWGFILFARNIETPEQVARLTAELRDSVGRDAPVFLDQEGGRVQRLGPPHWRQWEPPLDFAAHLPLEIRREAFRLRYRLIAEEMRAIGIDADCAPMLDVPTADTHPFLLNRCYARDPAQIAALGRAVAEGLMAGGVLPVIKHVPGHGRAVADSHHELPIVSAPGAELEVDFAPFAALADLPMAMTAHVIYEALDSGRCATLSPAVIDMIRGKIGFDGLLMTDDLAMKALTGAWGDRVEASLAAGCDIVLHCNGEMDEKRAVAEACPRLVGRALERADAAIGWRMDPQPLGDAAERLERLLREDAHA